MSNCNICGNYAKGSWSQDWPVPHEVCSERCMESVVEAMNEDEPHEKCEDCAEGKYFWYFNKTDTMAVSKTRGQAKGAELCPFCPKCGNKA